MNQSSNVIAVTAENFAALVIDESFKRPVLVDFWADWCAPCRTLMPLLAKLAEEYDGRFLLAKVDTEQEQELAAHFGVRSLPTVQLIHNGQAVDQFMGALPEPQVREFLDRHVPGAGPDLFAELREQAARGDLTAASATLEHIQAEDANNPRLPIAHLQLTAARGDRAATLSALDRLPIELAHDPEVAAIRARVLFAEVLEQAPDAATLTQRLAADPADNQARYQLAIRHLASGHPDEGMELLLDLLRRDRSFQNGAAREALLAAFTLCDDAELVGRYRARMMSTLY